LQQADLNITEAERDVLRALDATVHENLEIFPKPGQFHEARHARELLTLIRLTTALQEHRATASRQTRVLIRLTWVLVVLTIVIAVATLAVLSHS